MAAEDKDKLVNLEVLGMVSDRVNDARDQIVSSENTGHISLIRGNFKRGVYNPASGKYTPYSYRVGARSEIIYPYPVTITTKPGYAIYYYTKNDQDEWVTNDWTSGPYPLPANTPFMFQIRHQEEGQEEDQTAVADVNTFLSAVTVTGGPVDVISEQIDAISGNMDVISEQTDVISGRFDGYTYVDEYKNPDDTDDTNAIQAAVTASPSGGTVLFNPGKTYTISDTITINKSDLKLKALAAGTHTPTIKASSGFESGKPMFAVRSSSVCFNNLTIEGNYNTNGILYNRKLSETATEEVIHLDAMVDHCYLRYQNTGISAYGRNCKIINSHFSGCLHGIAFSGISVVSGGNTVWPDTRGWMVVGCRFHSIGQYWYTGQNPIYTPPSQVTFTSTDQVEQWNCYGIKITATDARNIWSLFEDNIVDGDSYGPLFNGTSEGVTLRNNYMPKDNHFNVLAYLVMSKSVDSGLHAVVSDNIVMADRSDDLGSNSSLNIGNHSAVFITGSKTDATLKNNTFYNYGSSGVYIRNCKHVDITGNYLKGVNYDDTAGAIFINGNLSGTDKVAVANNVVVRHPGRTGTDNLVSSTTIVDSALSTGNAVKNVTNNIS